MLKFFNLQRRCLTPPGGAERATDGVVGSAFKIPKGHPGNAHTGFALLTNFLLMMLEDVDGEKEEWVEDVTHSPLIVASVLMFPVPWSAIPRCLHDILDFLPIFGA